MLSPFEDFAKNRDKIDARLVSEPRQPMVPGEWAEAIFEWWKGTRKSGESKSEAAFAEAAKLGGRATFTKVRDGARKPRHDTFKRLNAIAPPHLKNYGMGQAGDATPAPLPERDARTPGAGAAGYVAQTDDAGFIAKKLDAMDEATRETAAGYCLEALRRAREGPRRAQPRGSTRIRWTTGSGAR